MVRIAEKISPVKWLLDGKPMDDIETTPSPKQFRMLAERLCLDFANTVGDHATDHPDEYLDRYADLVLWSEQAGILTDTEADTLYRSARKSRDDAADALEMARDLREVIYRIFSSAAAGNSASEADLEFLNATLEAYPVQLHVKITDGKYVCEWLGDNHTLDGILAPIAWSAATLLASDELRWVKQCGDEDCGWLFLDTTKNHSRRWCDMADCGSRAKAKHYYRRQHPK